MDFTLNDEQQAIADLSAQLLGDQATPTRIKELEDGDELVFDRELWAKLAEANLLGVAIPEAQGGLGFGPVELGLLLEQVGRTVAPVPVLAALAYGAAPVARFGTEAQRDALLPGVVAGTSVLTAALVEPLGDPLRPTTSATAEPTGGGWVLDGLKTCVPAGLVADRVLVSATTPDGPVGLFVVDPAATGVDRQRQDTITRMPEALIELTGVAVGRRRAGRATRRRGHHRRLAGRARDRGHLRGGDGRGRVRAAADRRLHDHPRAVRPAHRHVPGRRPAGRQRLHRHRGDPADHAEGRLVAGRRAARRPRRWRWPSTSRPRPASAWCGRPRTCTAGSASTATTPCTATTCGPSSSSSPSAAPAASSPTLGRLLADEPVTVD